MLFIIVNEKGLFTNTVVSNAWEVHLIYFRKHMGRPHQGLNLED